jgi:hypothetical protein
MSRINYERHGRVYDLLLDIEEERIPLPREAKDKELSKKAKEEGWFSCPISFIEQKLSLTATEVSVSRDFLKREGYIQVNRGGRCGNHWKILD